MSQGRLIIITIFLIHACIVALGLGLGYVLTKNKDNDPTPSGKDVTEPKTTDPNLTISGVTNPSWASPSREGHYRYAAVSSDTGSFAQVGMYVKILF